MRLGREVVDGVHHEVDAPRQDLRGSLCVVEHRESLEPAGGMDQLEPLSHDLHLSFANRSLHRMELTVGVRHTHPIEVDEDEIAHGAPRQRLRREAPHPTDAHHENPCRHQRVQTGLGEEPRRAIETPMRAVAGFLGGGGFRGGGLGRLALGRRRLRGSPGANLGFDGAGVTGDRKLHGGAL